MEASDDYEEVTLVSCDGEAFTAKQPVVEISETIKNLIEDAGTDNPIPLPNVTGKVLKKVVDYCNHHFENPPVSGDGEDDQNNNADISPWDAEFCKVDQATLFELILAANYLDVKDLLDVTCKTVANMIKGKTPEEIRRTFNIKNDFTAEEEEQIRKENEWCEEK